MMKNNQGVTHILIFLAVAVISAAMLIIFVLQSSENGLVSYTNPVETVSPSPVSESTDIDTIEAEIDETIISSPDDDIDSMESDASSL